MAFIIACVCVCVWTGERSPANRKHTTEPLTDRRALTEETPAVTPEVTAQRTASPYKKRSILLTKKRRLKRNRKYLVTVMHPFAMVISVERQESRT